MSPDPHDQHDPDEHERQERHEQREIDPDAPGRWIANPEGDAPEPNEPA
jgi:hypothetical protein